MTPLRFRPLQTTLLWEYHGRPRLLAVTWAADASVPGGARVCAVQPMAGQHHMPIGLPAICVAVTVALWGGMSLTEIVEAADGVEHRMGDTGYGFRPVETVGALARRLIEYQDDGAPAASYAIEHGPTAAQGRGCGEDAEGDAEG